MERTILHVAIDSFHIQAERFRCPKLAGRPVALAPEDSPRPRVVAASREARAAGVYPGTPLVVARRLCRDLIALPPDRGFYAGLGEAILERLAPFAPVVEPGGAGGGASTSAGASASGRFFLDLTGVARTPAAFRDRAGLVGREVEAGFRLHPTLGLAANKLVSRVAAGVVAPDGDLLDVPCGSEEAFLAPLPVRVLPAARGAEEAARLALLNVRWVRELVDLPLAQLLRVFGEPGLLLWRQARGVDSTPVRPPERAPRIVADETLARETNDARELGSRVARLALEIGAGLRARREAVRSLALSVEHADGRAVRAQRSFAPALSADAELRAAAAELLARALTRRVRVRRLRLEGWGIETSARQLGLWEEESALGRVPVERVPVGRAAALESALDRVRARFGAEALLPASWILHGLAVRPSSRP